MRCGERVSIGSKDWDVEREDISEEERGELSSLEEAEEMVEDVESRRRDDFSGSFCSRS